jgi:hypothetical protein
MKNQMFSSVRYLAIGLLTFFGVLGTAHAQSGYNRHVLVANDSSYPMVSFYASNTARGVWEEDILGAGILRSGQQININIDDRTGRCHFDFKAVFSNGAEIIRRNVDVCSVATWTINNSVNRLD